MRTTEQSAKIQSPRTGIFATLCAFLSAKGTRAPKLARSSCLPALAQPVCSRRECKRSFGARSAPYGVAALALTAFALTATPALAAAPQTPTLTVESPVHATEAVFLGTLNPTGPAEPGNTYSFLYKASKSKVCAGGASTTPGVALTGEPEVLPAEPVTGLTASTEYAVCLQVTNSASETATSPPVTFLTATPPEKPVTSTPAKSITSTSALLEGTVNPLKEAVTGYFFAWAATGKCSEAAEGGTSTPVAPAKLKAFKASASAIALQPNRKYEFCLLATNEAGDQTPGNEVSVTTKPAPPKVEHESVALPVKATEAHLEGTVNPNNQLTECHFQYGEALVSEHVLPCTPEVFKGFGGQAVEANVSGLSANTTYRYRIIARNGSGEEETGPEETFTTALPPEAPQALKAEAIAPTEATLHGVLNPVLERTREPGSYEFRYRASATECQGGAPGEEKATPATPAPGLEKDAPAEAKLEGLLPGTTYTFCLLASNEAGEASSPSPPLTFTTLPVAPTLSAEAATSLTATSATLTAKVNPNGAEVTACVFEYGTEAGVYPHAVSCAPSPGSGNAAVPVSGQAEPLKANIPYHWRITATNAAGTATGTDHTFLYGTAPKGLPDSRAYEQVTPVQKNGALISDLFAGSLFPDIASDGSRMIAASIQCFGNAESCTAIRREIGSPYAFTRTSGGWQTNALAPAAGELGGISTAWSYSATQGTALFSAPSGPGGGEEWYERDSEEHFRRIGPQIAPGVVIPPTAEGTFASTDYSHFVWEARRSSWPFDPTVDYTYYEYAGGGSQPLLLTVNGPYASHDVISRCGNVPLAGNPGVLSGDGRTFFFQPQICTAEHNAGVELPVKEVYARVDNSVPDAAHTITISEPQAPPGEVDAACEKALCVKNTSLANAATDWRGASFEGASGDGNHMFFTSTQQLTDTASQDANPNDRSGAAGCHETTEVGGCNLYEFECAACREPSERHLVDVSAGAPEGEGPQVRGVLGFSSDGSHVYFVASGELTKKPNSRGQVAQAGRDNLYVYAAGHVSFITVLPESDSPGWESGTGRPANVTPNGRFLVFLSHGQLTADDTSVSGAYQVFRYDAQTGQLVRISVGEGGFADNGNRAAPTPCSFLGCSEDARISAGNAFQPTGAVSRLYTTMSEDGQRVFFQSPVALTAGALDDVRIATDETGDPVYAQNVYEWEAGHVYLISDGRDVSKNAGQAGVCGTALSSVCLLGTDSTGSNAFFSTVDPLVPADTDTQLDYYDARVGGGFPAASAAPPCLGEACHGTPPATPSSLTPGSATFNGAGNLAPPPPAVVKPKTAAQIRAEKLTKALKSCKKDRKKAKRKSCEKQARKKYGAKASAKRSSKASRAINDRRAK